MQIKKRYFFWKIFWIVLAVYIFFSLLGIIVVSVSPVTDKTPSLNKLFGWKNLVNQCVNIFFSTLFYYFTLNVFYKLIAGRKNTIYFIKPAALSILGLGAYYAISFFLIKNKILDISSSATQENLTLGLMIFSYIISTVFYLGISLLIAYLTYLRDEKKQRKILEEQKMQLEVEKSQANFNFLKAQINPHFLHNTLNFLYAKSLPYSPELSEGILTLSDIMRYALSEGNARDGKAPLKDEIEHVRNVIKINQLRFSNNLHVNFQVNGLVNGATIIPFVLITIVENAFKHGDLKASNQPIEIALDIEGNKLKFYCHNKKKMGPKEISTGLGLDNIKKRLDLAYGNQYSLLIKDEANLYTTELIINDL